MSKSSTSWKPGECGLAKSWKPLPQTWESGQSGNPVGRPPNSRNKLTGAFMRALAADFEEHGVQVIENARLEDPVQYLKIVASLVPKEITGEDGQALFQNVTITFVRPDKPTL